MVIGRETKLVMFPFINGLGDGKESHRCVENAVV
jgi:hypothetical protein